MMKGKTMKPSLKNVVMLIVGVLLLHVAPASGLSVPQLINYQGLLTDGQGEPLATAEYPLSFAIYDSPADGTVLWGPQSFVSVPVVRGHFNIILGPQDDSMRDIDLVFVNAPETYLEVTVNDAAIVPRQRILSAPYAFQAEHAATADHSVEADHAATADHSTTSNTADVALLSPPVGCIIAWHKSLSGTPALPAGWVECNGQVLNLQDSPYNDQTIPNLNGTLTSISGASTKGRFLRGHTASGLTEQDQSNAVSAVKTDAWDNAPTDTWEGIPENGGDIRTSTWYQDSRDSMWFKKYGRETRPQSFTVVWIMRVK
jgi:hypothetical protein